MLSQKTKGLGGRSGQSTCLVGPRPWCFVTSGIKHACGGWWCLGVDIKLSKGCVTSVSLGFVKVSLKNAFMLSFVCLLVIQLSMETQMNETLKRKIWGFVSL